MHVIEYVNKIRSAAKKKDIFAASFAASELQLWVAEIFAIAEEVIRCRDYFHYYSETGSIYEKFGLPNMIQSISDRDFELLDKQVLEIDSIMRQYCHDRGIHLDIFNTMDDLDTYLLK